MSDVFTSYETGLTRLLGRLGSDHPRYTDVLVYQQRLQENIDQARKYGDTEALRHARAQIVDTLNRLALETVGVSLGDLSSKEVPPLFESPEPVFEKSEWNTAAIRDLLTGAFNDEELATLCYDHFRPVYDSFSLGMSRRDKIERLIEHCKRYALIPVLLARVKEVNPVKYAQYETETRAHQHEELLTELHEELQQALADQDWPTVEACRRMILAIEPDDQYAQKLSEEVYQQARALMPKNPVPPLTAVVTLLVAVMGIFVTIVDRSLVGVPAFAAAMTAVGGFVLLYFALAREWVEFCANSKGKIRRVAVPKYPKKTRIYSSVGGVICAVLTIALVWLASQPCFVCYKIEVQVDGTTDTEVEITVEVSGKAPLSFTANANSVAEICVPCEYAGRPSTFTVEASGYQTYRQNLVLGEEALPSRVPLTIVPGTPTATPTNTPTATPTNTPTLPSTSTLTPMPTSVPTPTPTPTITPTSTPDCQNVQVSYLELVLVDSPDQQATPRYPGQNEEIVIARSQIDGLWNLQGQAILTGTNVADCTCYWVGNTNGDNSMQPINSQTGKCAFSILLPDQVTVINLMLTIGGGGGPTRLFKVRVQ